MTTFLHSQLTIAAKNGWRIVYSLSFIQKELIAAF